MEWVKGGGLRDWLPQATSLEESRRLLKKREIKRLWDAWKGTPEASRPQLLKSWLGGPGGVYPARVANESRFGHDLPRVDADAPIHSQLRRTNPFRSDCGEGMVEEALFDLPRKAPCHLCGAEDTDQLSNIVTSCDHSICTVCYTVTYREHFKTPPSCSLRCGGVGRVQVPARQKLEQLFVPAKFGGSF